MGYNEYDEDMRENAAELEALIVGHKIVKVEKNVKIPMKTYSWGSDTGTAITLDNGKRVFLEDTSDCCAYTELESFLFNEELADHIITSVKTEDSCQTWFILADMAEVLKFDVSWSEGSGYYGVGFTMRVFDAAE